MAQLFLIRKFTVNQEPSGFRESRLFCKIFNGVSSVAQHTMFAIDERDRAFGATGVQVTVIQRDKARTLAERTDIETVLAFSAINDGEFVAFSVVF